MKLKHWLTPTAYAFFFLSFFLAGTGGYLLWLSHQSYFEGEDVIGSIVSIQGTSEVRSSGSPFWSPLFVGYEIRSKDKVKTSSNGLVAIKFNNNDVIKILPNSSVTLTDPSQKEIFKIEIGNFQVEKANSVSSEIDTHKINKELENENKKKQIIQIVQDNKISQHLIDTKKHKEWSPPIETTLPPPEFMSPLSFSKWDLLEQEKEKKIIWNGNSPQYQLRVQWEHEVKLYETSTNFWILSDEIVKDFKEGSFPLIIQVRGIQSKEIQTLWSQPLTLTLQKKSSLQFSLSHTNVKMICKEDQWICENPIKLQFLKHFNKSFELVWTAKDTNEKFLSTLDSHQLSSSLICPPQPNSSWNLQIREQKINPNDIQNSAIAEIKAQSLSPPDIHQYKSRSIDPTLLLLQSPNCQGTLIEFSGLSKKTKETFNLKSRESIEVLPVNTSDEWTLQSRYLNKNKKPLSDWSSPYIIKQFSIDLSGLEKKMGNSTTQWMLKDSGNIYLLSKNTKPWSSLQWSSDPLWPEYEVQIFSDEKLENKLLSKKQKTRAFTLKIPENTYEIYWRVRGIKDSLVSSWSPTHKIEIKKLGTQANDDANKAR